MKSEFFDYYPPESAQYDGLWKQAVIVLDTNVLLALYKLPALAREELMAVLESFQDRLWIPYQVALEFQRNRLSAISGERKFTEGALQSTRELVGALRQKIDRIEIDKRGLGLSAEPILNELEQANQRLLEAIEKVHTSQLDIAASDPIRERLDTLLRDRVGPGPKDQSELDQLIHGGEDRYTSKIPPGYADADKEKGSDGTFIHNHQRYQRKFGDLILWRQLLNKAASSGKKHVILVTSDQKEDWWWREQGKTIGPQPELIREIRREAQVDLFWMYTLDKFLENSKAYTAATISEGTVAEIRTVSAISIEVPKKPVWYGGGEAEFDQTTIMSAVEDWLLGHYDNVRITFEGFPDFITRLPNGDHGFEVKYIRNFDKMLFSPPVINSMLRGYLEVHEGRLNGFTMVVVIPALQSDALTTSGGIQELRRRVASLTAKYPVSAMVVGSVSAGKFEDILVQAGGIDLDDGS